MLLSNLSLSGSNGSFYKVLDFVSPTSLTLGKVCDKMNVSVLNTLDCVEIGVIKNALGLFYVPLHDSKTYLLLQEKLTDKLFVYSAEKFLSQSESDEFVLSPLKKSEITSNAELLALQKKLYAEHKQEADMKNKVLTSVFGDNIKLSYPV